MSSRDEPRVTIVIPCYNQADFLSECLASILVQTFAAWEAIVIDDASTVGNPELVVEGFHDTRIKSIRHDRNQGPGEARNTGFRAAQGSLVLPLDADDKLEPTFLAKTVALIDADINTDCVYTDFQLFGASTAVWHNRVRMPADMLRGQWIPGAGTLMRKGVWEKVGGYIEMPGNEDWDFWIAAVQHDLRVAHLPEALYCYRRATGSRSVSTQQIYDYVARDIMYRRHKAFFDQHEAGAHFRASGYLNSARAAARRGRPIRAGYLFARYAALWPKRTLNRSKKGLRRWVQK